MAPVALLLSGRISARTTQTSVPSVLTRMGNCCGQKMACSSVALLARKVRLWQWTTESVVLSSYGRISGERMPISMPSGLTGAVKQHGRGAGSLYAMHLDMKVFRLLRVMEQRGQLLHGLIPVMVITTFLPSRWMEMGLRSGWRMVFRY